MLYFICCTTRTGSTLLCDLLAQTGRHGNAHEFYEPLLFDLIVKPHGGFTTLDEELRDPARYLAKLRAAKSSPDGGCGIKVQALQLDRFAPVLESDAAEEVRGARFVRLSREDRLAQAISGVKALQTGSWHSGQASDVVPQYDAAAIELQLHKIAAWEEQWDSFFARHGVEPLCLTYEQLVADLPARLQQVGEHIGPPVTAVEAATLQPRIARQSDSTNTDWRKRFGAGVMAGE